MSDLVKRLRDSCYLAFDDGTNDYASAHKAADRIKELEADLEEAIQTAERAGDLMSRMDEARLAAEAKLEGARLDGFNAGIKSAMGALMGTDTIAEASEVLRGVSEKVNEYMNTKTRAELDCIRREARNEALEEAAKHHDRHAYGYRHCSSADAAAHEEHARRIRAMMEDDDAT